ncbi:MAG: sodium/solute symporter [Cytophagaceae bacterium]|jgi:SSS family solute:Na+ symporter|nr:sodium/solute symporter [Cytophagaceae bacterium]
MLFQTLDLVIVSIYVVGIIVYVFFTAEKSKNVSQYFLANRSMPWYIIGPALFMTDVSSMAVIGLVQEGHDAGLAVSNFVLSACVVLLLLAWFFAPFYLKTGVLTLPKYLEKRYNRQCKMYLSVISILAYVLTKVSVILLAGGLIISAAMGWDLYTSCLMLVLITGMYTLGAGSKGIIKAQSIQFVVFLIGSIVLLWYAWQGIGGLEGVQTRIPQSHFNIFKPITDSSFPWPGMVVGALILGIWYWTTDQYIVQIVLSSKNTEHARSGAIWAAWLRLLPIVLLVFPGMIAKGLYPDIPSSEAYVTMLRELIPPGVKAVVVLGLLSALMSSLSSCFNATATLFTLDIYNTLYPKANDFVLLNIGRIATFVMVIFGIIWVPFINAISNDIYRYVQGVQAYIAPPVCVVFMVGILWPRANDKAAIRVLMGGFGLGALKFLADILFYTFDCSWYAVALVAQWHSLYFAIALFFLSIVCMVVISYVYEKPSKHKIIGYTLQYANPGSSLHQRPRWHLLNVLATVGLILALLVYWLLFG